jgi:hypothetical protein
LYGLGAAYPSFANETSALATPAYAPIIDYVKSHCAIDVVQKYANVELLSSTYFQGGVAVLGNPIIRVS